MQRSDLTPDERIRVCVIGGGASGEHDVSLASAAGIAGALDRERYDVYRLTIGRDGGWFDGSATDERSRLTAAEAVAGLEGMDVVFPALHGVNGEDGTMAALMGVVRVPVVGGGIRPGALAMDKWVTKLIAGALGIATAPAVYVVGGRVVAGGGVSSPAISVAEGVSVAGLTYPVVVKPVAAGSSHGVSVVAQASDLPAAVDEARRHDEHVLIEQFVEGREVDVAVLEHADGRRTIGPALEIAVDKGDVFDTDQKYGGHVPFVIPARVTDPELEALRTAADTLFTALGCRGIARFDFFVTPGGVLLNEVNTMPGFTPDSQVPKMFDAIGIPYATLLDELLATARA
ncbi:D-alanine--D-alanine ligase [Okibacterium fritillariae]|uniref:D-alanine--D-alanine ligase n=1 Tax=Okibacterium fritillariae TaxID=123320 RepID=A0A1T5KVJ7_9MICO|nr:D-alanine--D-alanine ligase [Okibacterium fritillariae]SKC67683.1 D-alanine-D-alanine ligase [Okibacterium fritillariae]